ncbi:unnamed protein product [Rotaria sp. Silwood1]|nr:unnamed protein product [Rotaria sp. Silwood1]CAF3592793.1 unnamed protein product [Rotaria sp. Silwood1]CAF3672968.1 unnamed protein product [Rotaria sp. Silwood1]CAF4580890.1 unnamed protein product [Rotaria sp. Silwood1]CAF4636858.1 unnamed protein product [Rotaria sp. Silwood1]
MLLIKANHAQTIPMTQQEEDCFSATSYLIVQLCLHQKEPTKLFYGEVSTEIFPITEKPNPRDKSAVKTNRESDELTEKPNLKTARLPPDAPAARPFEPRQPDHNYRSDEQRYRDAAQQIRVCTTEETNEVESLLDPIIACLSSKFYRNVYENLIVNYVKVSKSNLAAKHLFFMRDCPEFLFRHDYKRQDEVAALLCTEMLNNAGFILEQNLPNLNNNEDDETTMNVHIEAVLYHIKLLNHFAQIPSIRKNFLETRILDEILQLLQNDTLIHNTNRIVDVKSLMIMQSIILLYNLGFSKEILSRMKRKNVIDICSKLCLMKDKMIQFVSQALIIRLDPKKIDEIPNPKSLTKFCLECMEKSVREPRRSYQGIKLNGVLKVLEILLENDIVQKTIVEEQEGMLFLTKFACIICPDNPTSDIIRKIRLSSLKIIWHLLSIVPTLNKKLKSNDLFIDHLLTFINKVSQKEKMIPNGIIWKLGHEETLRQEQAGKKKQIEEDDRTTTDDQYDSTDAWDDSVPFDLMMSYSDDSSEKSLCRKISNRLKSEDFKVYFEKQGKHRLESMKKAVLKQKLFLACLSAKYRASKVCMAEIEYASKSGCPIIPVIVGKNYTVKGWLNHLIGKRKTYFYEKIIHYMTQSSTTSQFYYACRNGHVDEVREQLPKMTLHEIDQIQANGSTALHAACYYGHVEIVKLLLKRGASRSIQNVHKCLPYDEAEKEEIKKLFLRESSNRFSDDGTGHIDWMKCDDAAAELANEYRFRHAGFGWKKKDIDRRMNFIKKEMSHTDIERVGEFLNNAELEQNPWYLLKAYTVESNFYKKLNRDLATKHFDQGTNSGITYFIDFFFNHPELGKLCFKGKVYRGMPITQDDLKQYGIGGKVMNKAFMSTTKDLDIAKEFAKNNLIHRQTEHGTQVKMAALCIYEIINDRTALDIEQVSEYKFEKEVLVGPYTAFVITAIRKIRPDYVEIDLRECEKVNDDDEDDDNDD